MVAGIVGFYRRIPVCHVEAGLRSFDLGSPFPEEMHRVVVGSSRTFTSRRPSPRGTTWCERFDPPRVVITGNTVIDALMEMVERIGPMGSDTSGATHILMTLHRRDNFGQPGERVCDALGVLLERFPSLHLVWPVHPNPSIYDVAHEWFADHPRVRSTSRSGIGGSSRRCCRARLILSDSGGVQEEAPALGRPVLVLRGTTERGEAIETGRAALIGTDRDAVVDAVAHLLRTARPMLECPAVFSVRGRSRRGAGSSTCWRSGTAAPTVSKGPITYKSI